MKLQYYIIATVLACGCYAGKGQINYENAYPYLSNSWVGLINLGGNSYKYYITKLNQSTIILYNLDHSIYKQITIPKTGTCHIQYITNSLFDCDSTNVEYLLGSTDTNYVKVFREDGTEIFFADSATAQMQFNTQGPIIGYLDFPIKNTPMGAKMILRTGGLFKTYGLCGQLPDSYMTNSQGVLDVSQLSMFNLFPNPNNGTVTLEYQLPENESTGEIIIYAMSGNEMKRFKVDNTFKNVIIDNTQLPAGTYFYQLQTGNGVVGMKKMVVVR